MKRQKKRVYIVVPLLAVLFVALLVWIVKDAAIPVLQPEGLIASEQRTLFLFTLGLSALVVIPVFTLTFFIAWRYHEDNKKATYKPDFKSNKKLEAVWWGIPCIIILVLAGVTWVTSHSLDPYKPLASTVAPLRVQVVALEWKWLFIYPDQKVAAVNLLNIPEGTPIELSLTSDAPMNAFWVPSLGSQVYAMSGMASQLHLIADSVGTYKGRSSNISGRGFADMEFTVNAMAQTDFQTWIDDIRDSQGHLDQKSYEELAEPGIMAEPKLYVLADNDLFESIIMKYMPEHKESESLNTYDAMSDHAGMSMGEK